MKCDIQNQAFRDHVMNELSYDVFPDSGQNKIFVVGTRSYVQADGFIVVAKRRRC